MVTLGDNGYVIDNRRPIGYPKILSMADKNRYKIIDTDNDTSPISITITTVPDKYSKSYNNVWKNDNLFIIGKMNIKNAIHF